jgi:hypothetical protein
MSETYDRDFYAWANEQAALLRAGRLSDADIAHIAEEIESMGKTRGSIAPSAEMAVPAGPTRRELGGHDQNSAEQAQGSPGR